MLCPQTRLFFFLIGRLILSPFRNSFHFFFFNNFCNFWYFFKILFLFGIRNNLLGSECFKNSISEIHCENEDEAMQFFSFCPMVLKFTSRCPVKHIKMILCMAVSSHKGQIKTHQYETFSNEPTSFHDGIFF